MKRIAVVSATYRYLPAGEHIVDRFLVGYPSKGTWRHPDMKVVSCYVDQKPADDQSAERAREFGFTVYPTVAEALRCGGARLAADAVLLIGEQGDYRRNDLGQVLRPQHQWFRQCVEVFEKDGRAAPLYSDGLLSHSFEQAKWMVDASQRLKFRMLAGSPLPVTWRLPDLELPLDCQVDSAVMVGIDGSETISFHALEAMQCMIERRAGGETGVRAVQMIEGDAVWKSGDEGRWSKELLTSALSRSDSPQGLSVTDGRTQDLVGNNQLPKLVKRPAACFIEYGDGLRATLLMLNGAVNDFTFAARLKGPARNVSTQFLRLPAPNDAHTAPLAAKIEELFETGRAPYPVERSLIVAGIIESCLKSRAYGGRRIETPHLNVRYRAPKESQHARA